MTQDQVDKVHEVFLFIMDDIHRICVANNLKYYLFAGSALGAVRHKGFIPWDPDLDIVMPRKDYELFVTHYSNELNASLYCSDYRKDKTHKSSHAIVFLKNSSLLSATMIRNHLSHPFFVDIMPLDQVPDDAELKRKHEKDLNRVFSLMKEKYRLRRKTDSPIKDFIKPFAAFILDLFTPSIYKLHIIQQRIAQRFNELPESECPYLCCTSLSKYEYNKFCVPREIWGTPVLTSFEGRDYYVPQEVDKYLTHLFGDYLKYPTKEEQNKCLNHWAYAEWKDSEGNTHIINQGIK